MHRDPKPIYHFGPFCVDAWRGEVRRDEESVDLRPKPFRVLLYLLQHRDRAVPKEELLDGLWPGVAVSETALTTAIKYVRQALASPTAESSWIQSKRGVGYRFFGEVTESAEPEAPPTSPSPDPDPADWVVREEVASSLDRWLDDLSAGRGRVALVRGEAGIGKSRLLTELARRARGRGWGIATAWCPEDGTAPPYWPWTQLLRDFARASSWLRGPECASLRAELAPIVPEWADDGGRAAPAPEARFEIFDAVLRLLRGLSESNPILLLIDDLHGADPTSLRLLGFTAREIGGTSILIGASLREPAGEPGSDLKQTLGVLARLPDAEDLHLVGWSDVEVERLAETLPIDVPPEIVRNIAARAAGNPFYARELLLREHDRGQPKSAVAQESEVPGAVQDALRARLGRLAPICRAALASASVVGRTFNLRVLTRALGMQEREVAEILNEAVEEGLLLDALREYRFAHAIVREAILADISRPQLAKLHLKVAEALEDDPLGGDPEQLATLFGQAEGTHLRAAAYALRAGERAMAALAFENAVHHFERALSAIQVDEQPDPKLQCDLLVQLGRARMLSGAPQPIVRQTLLDAAEIAARHGDGDSMARALLGFQNLPSGAPEALDQTRIERTAEAIRLRGDREDETTVQLLCSHALHRLAYSRKEADRLLGRAEEISNQLGSQAARASTLHTRIVFGASRPPPAEMISLCRELATAADESELWELSSVARWRGALALLDAGTGDAKAELDRFGAFLSRHPVGRGRAHLPRIRALVAFLEGDLPGAERLLDEAAALASRMHNPILGSMCHAAKAFALREQGRTNILLPLYKTLAQRSPDAVLVRCALADTLARSGHLKEAREELSRLAEPKDARGFVSGNPVVYLAFLAEICHRLDERGRADTLYPLLAAHCDRHAVESQGTVALGSAERYAGLLADLLGEPDRAAAHFERAIAKNEAAGALLFAAHSRVDWARLLLRNGGDGEEAEAMLAQAARFSARRALADLDERIEHTRIEAQGAVPFPRRGRRSP